MLISSISYVDPSSGGLVNSAIRRFAHLSSDPHFANDEFLITYFHLEEEEGSSAEFYRAKYDLPANVRFMNFALAGFDPHGPVAVVRRDNTIAPCDGSPPRSYEDHHARCLAEVLDSRAGREVYLILESPLVRDPRLELHGQNVRIFFPMHNDHLHRSYDGVHRGATPWKSSGYQKPVQSGIADILFLTNGQRRDVEWISGRRSDFHTVPHWYQRSPVHVSREQRMVFVGRISWEDKQLDTLLKGYAAAGIDVPLDIYGAGPDVERTKQLIEELALGDRVTLRGITTTPDAAFASAQLAVLPTKFEGFGLTLLEAMANGTPVISTDVRYGPREMIVDGYNGYLLPAPLEPERLAEALQDFFRAQRFDVMSHAARTVAARYSPEAFAAAWRALATPRSPESFGQEPPEGVRGLRVHRSRVAATWPDPDGCWSLRAYSQDLSTFTEHPLAPGVPVRELKGKLLALAYLDRNVFRQVPLQPGPLSTRFRLVRDPRDFLSTRNRLDPFDFARIVWRNPTKRLTSTLSQALRDTARPGSGASA